MSADLHATAGTRLGQVGQRYTSNRRALVSILEQARQPLSIPDVLAQDRSLPQSSVYRNLAVLEQAGVVRRIVTSDEFSRYELAEDLTEHHHHLVCTSCGAVTDVQLSTKLERSMEKAIQEIASDTGFRPAGHRLDLVGLCATCD